MPPRQPHTGFTLIELLIVIAIVGILVGLVFPSSEPNLHEQLRAAAAIVKADMDYARSLAVTNNSKYKITFDIENNKYTLEHSGSNASLDTLPDSPFSQPEDPDDQHIVDLDELPHMGPTVRIVVVAEFGSTYGKVDDVEFGPLGETTRAGYTLIWLAAGSGEGTVYVWLLTNSTTGITEIGNFTSTGPPAWLISQD